MPQLHLPMFPTGVTHITNELAFEKKDGCITTSAFKITSTLERPATRSTR
jgi:hypothetical protein